MPAKWSYTEMLIHIDRPSTFRLAATDHDLNQTLLVNENFYVMQWNILTRI